MTCFQKATMTDLASVVKATVGALAAEQCLKGELYNILSALPLGPDVVSPVLKLS